MFHRELKINFGELEEAAEALQYYIRALEQRMPSSRKELPIVRDILQGVS